MRAITLDRAAVNLDEDDTAVDGPHEEERSDEHHLGERDGPESVETIPSKVVRLTIVGLHLFLILNYSVTGHNLTQKVHQSEDYERDYRGDDVQMKW